MIGLSGFVETFVELLRQFFQRSLSGFKLIGPRFQILF